MVGIDMNAALKIGAARGADLAALSELLPAAEAVWSRRCVAIEPEVMDFDQRQQWRLTA